MNVIENPLFLGTIVAVAVFLLRKFKWPVDGLKALWLTMGVAIVVALVERLLQAGIPNFLVCELVSEPVGFLTCLFAIVKGVLAEAGVIFAAAELIYQVLRREIAGRTVLGERI